MGTRKAEDFIPGTREVEIGRGVVYRPIRSWHSGTYAGERKRVQEDGDTSGCIDEKGRPYGRPYTVTHRLYWNRRDPERRVSVFLSYPGAMGACPEYFWEAYIADVERFATEGECEARILQELGDAAPQSG